MYIFIRSVVKNALAFHLLSLVLNLSKLYTSPLTNHLYPSQPAIIFSKLTIEKLEQGVKYVQT